VVPLLFVATVPSIVTAAGVKEWMPFGRVSYASGVRSKMSTRQKFDEDLRYGEERQGAFCHMMKLEPVFEIKSDKRCKETGNVYVEYEQNLEGRWRPSGISVSDCSYWAFELRPDNWFLIPLDELRLLFNHWRAKHPEKCVSGGDDKMTHGLLIPVDMLFRRGK
jgi:hypothetical protein